MEDIRYTTGYKELYSLRSHTIERIFADAKELYELRYTKHRGLKKVIMELNLLFASMNLKKLANHIFKYHFSSLFFLFFNLLFLILIYFFEGVIKKCISK